MSERTALTKISETKGKSPSTKPKGNLYQSMDSPVEDILHLQQTIGNQAVQRLLKSGAIQAKLKIGQPNDKYELEADRIADKVMSMPEPKGSLVNSHSSLVQKKSTCPGCPEKEEIQTKPLVEQITPLVQRQVGPGEEEEPIQTQLLQRQETGEEEKSIQTKLLQRKEAEEEEEEEPIQRQEAEEEEAVQAKLLQRQENGEEEKIQPKGVGPQSQTSASTVESGIHSLKGGGKPLPESTRSYFEPRFGADFNQVKVHSDSKAADAAKSINARAFTTGRDVVFGSGQYSPGTSTGKKLLAHELTHVVQQGASPAKNNSIQKKPEEGETAQPKGDTIPGVLELKGKGQVLPSDPAALHLNEAGIEKGTVNARFGKVAQGPIEVKKEGDAYKIEKHFIPLNHPLFARIGETMPGLQPGLTINTVGKNISGYIGLGKPGAKAPDIKDLAAKLKKAPAIMGLQGFELPKLPEITNKLEAGMVHVGLNNIDINIGGVFSGTVSLEANEESITKFEGSANVDIQGLASATMELKRSKEGTVTGKVAAEVNLPKNITGSVDVEWDGQAVTGEGKVGYQGEKLSGEVILRVMEKSKARQLEQQNSPPEKEKKEKKPGGKQKKEDYVVFGEGNLTFSFSDWLSGAAHVIIDSQGFLTIIGEITPQAEVELFSQKDYIKKLFKVEARASYGIPVVGNIFIFANIGMDAFAKLGPAKLYNIQITGTYSTDPKKSMDFSIRGSLNISAAAGLRLRGEAGAGLEALAHDIKAGAGINAIAGIKGYAEATPVIGYKEKPAAGGEDKKGEFFISGELEIAAQPFLGLGGDLFVEIDAPWWSPVPDNRWTWPLGNKEWPIGGSFGINASVDYIIGSDQLPAIEFKPVEFDSDKFMTDLYSDKAKSKSGDKDVPGKWKEKNSKDAAPPSGKGKKGDAQEGEAPKLAAAKPKVKPGTAKPSGQKVNPNAKTAEGKTVKQYREEASKKGKKPEAPGLKGGKAKESSKPKDESKKISDMHSDKVREEAGKVLMGQLKSGHTREETEKIIAQVFGQLKPRGLKRLELGPKNKDGNYFIFAETSPLKELLELKSNVIPTKSKYVVSAVRIVLRGAEPGKKPLDVEYESKQMEKVKEKLPGTSSRQVGVVENKKHQKRRYLNIEGDSDALKGTSGGVLFIPGKGEEKIELMTWNVGGTDYYKIASNKSHAEIKFINWFEKQPESWKMRVKAIEIVNDKVSPCDFCCDDLGKFLRHLNKFLERNDKPKIKKEDAKISWEKPFEAKDKHSGMSTTANGIANLKKGGWRISGPLPKGVTEESIEKLMSKRIVKTVRRKGKPGTERKGKIKK